MLAVLANVRNLNHAMPYAHERSIFLARLVPSRVTIGMSRQRSELLPRHLNEIFRAELGIFQNLQRFILDRHRSSPYFGVKTVERSFQ
jgi:hypothetical protein